MPQGHIINISPKTCHLQEITRQKLLISGFHWVSPSSSLLARETRSHFTEYLLRQKYNIL